MNHFVRHSILASLLFAFVSTSHVSRAANDENNGDATSTTREIVSNSLEGDTTGNIALTTDYIFRGRSLTQHQPALQGGLDWTNRLGIFAGVWGSNLHTPELPDAALELDAYAGYSFVLFPNVNASVGLTRYFYFQGNSVSTYEFPIEVTWKGWKWGLAISPEWEGTLGPSCYASVGWSDKVVWGFSFGVSAGYSIFSSYSGLQNYEDFRVSASREVAGLVAEISTSWVNITQFNGEDMPRLVVTVSKNF